MPQAQQASSAARLLAVGVGGGGVNAVNHMIEAGVRGVEFLAMNTDAQALELARTPKRLRLGEALTRGLGAGGNPEIGRKAAEESYTAIREALAGADMVFITAGMGGGTGTGASPLLAQAAREQGALTVAVVTTPFAFERQRKLVARDGVAALREVVDALIVVPNERLTALAARDLSAFEAYRLADDVLRQGIQGISDLITIPGLINLDFADIRNIMADAGSAHMSVGAASGENRAEAAARSAITNPLLNVDISGAHGIVFNITGGNDLTMAEVDRIADLITCAAHPDAAITFGTVYDPSSAGALKVTVVATGFAPRVAHANRQHLRFAKPHPSAQTGVGDRLGGELPVGMRVQRPIVIPPTEPERGERFAAAPLDGRPQAGPASHRTEGRTDQQVAPQSLAGERARYERQQTQPHPALPPAGEVPGGGVIPPVGDPAHWGLRLPVAPSPRMDESAPIQRLVARRLPEEGAVRPQPTDPSAQRRIPQLPGYHGDEFLANEEDDYADRPAPRSGWRRLFAGR
jgi:cell division protein FtsZ